MHRILALALLLCAATTASCKYVELEDFHTAYEIVKPGDGAAVKKGDTVIEACGSKTHSTARCSKPWFVWPCEIFLDTDRSLNPPPICR
jgi:hypothetical protein